MPLAIECRLSFKLVKSQTVLSRLIPCVFFSWARGSATSVVNFTVNVICPLYRRWNIQASVWRLNNHENDAWHQVYILPRN